MKSIQKELFSLQDLKYRDFHSGLMPTVDKEWVIGVRVPELKRLAKELFKREEYGEFLDSLPHKYYEENNLHAFLIMQIKNYDSCMAETERFLPWIDNWATCDGFRPAAFKNNLPQLLIKIKEWLKSDKPYTVRFAIGMLMTHFLDCSFRKEYTDMVANIRSEEYYVNMMMAWYFQAALVKQYDTAVRYIENKSLPQWVHNKTIQKAAESHRITDRQKEYLKSLK